jgi:hypothetical protein
MRSSLQHRLTSREDGLGSIVTQLTKVSRRINSVAAQQMVFSSLGLLIGAAGILVIAAFFLSASRFLAFGLILAALVLAGLPIAVTRAMRRFAGLSRTAAIADQKAELNGRLSTLVKLAEKEQGFSLWPFLVEDTVRRLDDFRPDRIEKHQVSPSIYGFIAACLVASLAGLMTYSARRHQDALRKVLKNFTFQVDPSEIAPSDGGDGGGAEVEGDPDTLRSLAERLEEANQGARAGHNAIDHLANKAKDMASSLQDRLTGRQPGDTPEKVKIRLAEALGDKPPAPPEQNNPGNNSGDSSKQKGGHPLSGGNRSGSERKANPAIPQMDSGADSGSDRNKPSALPPSAKSFDPGGPEAPGAGDEPVAGQNPGSSPDASGQTAGGGADPDHLMGPPDAPTHKSENFEIMIDARLSDRSPIANAQPYVPPKVKTPLSSYQHPDQPLDRGTVPASDRETVRRVFER